MIPLQKWRNSLVFSFLFFFFHFIFFHRCFVVVRNLPIDRSQDVAIVVPVLADPENDMNSYVILWDANRYLNLLKCFDYCTKTITDLIINIILLMSRPRNPTIIDLLSNKIMPWKQTIKYWRPLCSAHQLRKVPEGKFSPFSFEFPD